MSLSKRRRPFFLPTMVDIEVAELLEQVAPGEYTDRFLFHEAMAPIWQELEAPPKGSGRKKKGRNRSVDIYAFWLRINNLLVRWWLIKRESEDKLTDQMTTLMKAIGGVNLQLRDRDVANALVQHRLRAESERSRQTERKRFLNIVRLLVDLEEAAFEITKSRVEKDASRKAHLPKRRVNRAEPELLRDHLINGLLESTERSEIYPRPTVIAKIAEVVSGVDTTVHDVNQREIRRKNRLAKMRQFRSPSVKLVRS